LNTSNASLTCNIIFRMNVDTKMLHKVRLAALQSLILKWSTALAPSAPSLPKQNKKA
jgi:hypothetical protein